MVRSRGGEGAAFAIQTVVSFCGCSFIRLVIFDLVSEWFCFLLLLENIYRVVYDVGSKSGSYKGIRAISGSSKSGSYNCNIFKTQHEA